MLIRELLRLIKGRLVDFPGPNSHAGGGGGGAGLAGGSASGDGSSGVTAGAGGSGMPLPAFPTNDLMTWKTSSHYPRISPISSDKYGGGEFMDLMVVMEEELVEWAAAVLVIRHLINLVKMDNQQSGGGGGGSGAYNSNPGGNGGSGLVVIRYQQ